VISKARGLGGVTATGSHAGGWWALPQLARTYAICRGAPTYVRTCTYVYKNYTGNFLRTYLPNYGTYVRTYVGLVDSCLRRSPYVLRTSVRTYGHSVMLYVHTNGEIRTKRFESRVLRVRTYVGAPMRLEKGWVGRCYVPRPAFAFWIREYIRRCSGVQHVTTYVLHVLRCGKRCSCG